MRKLLSGCSPTLNSSLRVCVRACVRACGSAALGGIRVRCCFLRACCCSAPRGSRSHRPAHSQRADGAVVEEVRGERVLDGPHALLVRFKRHRRWLVRCIGALRGRAPGAKQAARRAGDPWTTDDRQRPMASSPVLVRWCCAARRAFLTRLHSSGTRHASCPTHQVHGLPRLVVANLELLELDAVDVGVQRAEVPCRERVAGE